MQEAGRWTYPMQGTACDFAVLSCRNDNQCPQGALGVCAEGREGKACNNCKEGYFPLENGTCQKCQEADLLPAIAIFILIPMAIILLSCFNMDPNQQSSLAEYTRAIWCSSIRTEILVEPFGAKLTRP